MTSGKIKREARNRTAVEMRRAGKSLREIGECLGLTRERVRQIVTAAGTPHMRARSSPPQGFAADYVILTAKQLVTKYGTTGETIHRWAADLGIPRREFARGTPKGTRGKLVTREAEFRADWTAGMLLKTMARKYGVSLVRVSIYARILGLPPRHRRVAVCTAP